MLVSCFGRDRDVRNPPFDSGLVQDCTVQVNKGECSTQIRMDFKFIAIDVIEIRRGQSAEIIP